MVRLTEVVGDLCGAQRPHLLPPRRRVDLWAKNTRRFGESVFSGHP